MFPISTRPFPGIGSICLYLSVHLISGIALSQAPSPNSVLHKSLAFHDPYERWDTTPFELVIKESRPGKEDRRKILFFHIHQQQFHLDHTMGNHRLEYKIDSGKVSLLYDGSDHYSGEMQKKYKLSADHAFSLRDYYMFLFCLPMKMRDPGAIWDPVVKEATFNDQSAWAVRVTYEPSVGNDTWFFYFDKETYAILGCRFYHDEQKGDGEYITFSGIEDINGVKFPKIRRWHLNRTGTFLGSDTIE